MMKHARREVEENPLLADGGGEVHGAIEAQVALSGRGSAGPSTMA